MSDNRGDFDADFAAFNDPDAVKVGESNIAANQEADGAAAAKPPAKRGPDGKFAAATDGVQAGNEGGDQGNTDGGENGGNQGDEGGDQGGDEGNEDEAGKRRRPPSERIQELSRQRREAMRRAETAETELAALRAAQKPSGQAPAGGATDALGAAPDPTDQAKYPLGHLDDRYIEDKLDWLAEKKAAEKADAALQRQQGETARQRQEAEQTRLRETVDSVSDKGTALFDDYHETVVETALRGEWALSQPTFEAAAEADHGAEILRELSLDKAEAKRVAALSPLQQLRYVDKRDAELKEKAKGRTKPGAGAPPATRTAGANSSTKISPSTDNLDDFEKAWDADAKGGRK